MNKVVGGHSKKYPQKEAPRTCRTTVRNANASAKQKQSHRSPLLTPLPSPRKIMERKGESEPEPRAAKVEQLLSCARNRTGPVSSRTRGKAPILRRLLVVLGRAELGSKVGRLSTHGGQWAAVGAS